MTITEPMTMLTDYVLAVLCIAFAFSLSVSSQGRSVGLWTLAFLVTAVAATAGGTAHGFRIPLGEHWAKLWSLTVWSIGASTVLLLAAGVRAVTRSESRNERARRAGIRWLERGILISLVGLVILVGKLSIHRHFNQNDLYHVVQMGGLYCLYRGALFLHGAVP